MQTQIGCTSLLNQGYQTSNPVYIKYPTCLSIDCQSPDRFQPWNSRPLRRRIPPLLFSKTRSSTVSENSGHGRLCSYAIMNVNIKMCMIGKATIPTNKPSAIAIVTNVHIKQFLIVTPPEYSDCQKSRQRV